MDDCDVISTNRIEHRGTCNGKRDLSELGGRGLHLHFRLNEAELHAFAFGEAAA